jgi:hypothetical protein
VSRRGPLLERDIRARKDAPRCPRDSAFWRRGGLLPNGICADREQQFIDACAAEIDHYRLSVLVDKQDRAATLEAEREVIGHWERLQKNLTRYPKSVRQDVAQWLQLSEPNRAQIEDAKRQSKARAGRVIGHRGPAVFPILSHHAHTLQRIACEFSPSLSSDWKALRRWLGEILIRGSKARNPGKNARTRYFESLMLPRTSQGGVDLAQKPGVQALAEIPKNELQRALEEKLVGKLI